MRPLGRLRGSDSGAAGRLQIKLQAINSWPGSWWGAGCSGQNQLQIYKRDPSQYPGILRHSARVKADHENGPSISGDIERTLHSLQTGCTRSLWGSFDCSYKEDTAFRKKGQTHHPGRKKKKHKKQTSKTRLMSRLDLYILFFPSSSEVARYWGGLIITWIWQQV